MYIIYRITNNINKKCYIGYTTKSIEERWKRHCRASQPTHFYNAIKKYGVQNFTLETLCYGENDKAGLTLAEPLLIAYFKPEYNQTLGGEGTLGRRNSLETRKKMSKAAIRRWFRSSVPPNTIIYMA